MKQSIYRCDLYDLVWAEPMGAVAARFRISDVGLAKACRRNKIPIPPRGYWAKERSGKRVRRKPLAADSKLDSSLISITSLTNRSSQSADDLPGDIAALVAAESSKPEPLVSLRSPMHPTLAAWFGHETHKLSVIERRQKQFLSALIRRIESLGGRVSLVNNQRLNITLAGEALEVSLREKLRQERVPLANDDFRRSWYPNRDSTIINKPTGALLFQIENYFAVPLRRRWHDRQDARLEKQLRPVVIGLLQATAVERHTRLEREERERERIRIERERLAVEEQRRNEAVRLQELVNEANAWAQARLIRQYVDAVLASTRPKSTSSSGSEAWAAWAKTQADRLDPPRRLNQQRD